MVATDKTTQSLHKYIKRILYFIHHTHLVLAGLWISSSSTFLNKILRKIYLDFSVKKLFFYFFLFPQYIIFFPTVQHGDPVTHTCIQSFFSYLKHTIGNYNQDNKYFHHPKNFILLYNPSHFSQSLPTTLIHCQPFTCFLSLLICIF